MIRWIVFLLTFLVFPSVAFGQALEIFPRTIDLEIRAVGLDLFKSSEDFLQIRIETRSLNGKKWRLWIKIVVPPESFGKRFRPEALSWTARSPFISGSLLPSEKVLVGEGLIDGRTVEGRLVWRAKEGTQTAGKYRGRVMLILEELP